MSDTLHFLRRFLADPVDLGAVSPASRRLGTAVGAATRTAALNGSNGAESYMPKSVAPPSEPNGMTIVELGAGTGSLTQHISGLNPVVVERNSEWAALLRKRFPNLEIRTECATVALARISKPVGLVSSIPLLNNPLARDIKRLIRRKYDQGLIRFCIVYTYGWSNPLAAVGFAEGRRERFVMRNLPPAFVWAYR